MLKTRNLPPRVPDRSLIPWASVSSLVTWLGDFEGAGCETEPLHDFKGLLEVREEAVCKYRQKKNAKTWPLN